MLLFRVARVTLSFTSATPAGAATGCLSYAALLPARCQSRAARLSLEKQVTGELQGQLSLGLVVSCAFLPKLLIPVTRVWIGALGQPVGG